jgi:hypothetical protein
MFPGGLCIPTYQAKKGIDHGGGGKLSRNIELVIIGRGEIFIFGPSFPRRGIVLHGCTRGIRDRNHRGIVPSFILMELFDAEPVEPEVAPEEALEEGR